MTNSNDIFAELAYAKSCARLGDIKGVLEALDQAEKLWSAERDYWALIEVDAKRNRVDL